MSGHHDHDAPTLPATHRRFTIRGATIARLDNGKLSSSRDYWDMAGFLREVGVVARQHPDEPPDVEAADRELPWAGLTARS